jgi:coenzyme F420 biosynthesis associated uncharacterized protein
VQWVVETLRAAAESAVEPVRAVTGLHASDSSRVLVVDRPTWVEANVESLHVMLEPVLKRLPEGTSPAAAGIEAGALLGLLSTRVLGQYDVFGGDRLLLVAPNIWGVARTLHVELGAFAQWVALHEETHRAQLTAVPWLRVHMRQQIEALADGFEPHDLTAALAKVVQAVVDALAGKPGPSLAEVLQSPRQREVLENVVGVMALLEGHADVVMDEVGRTMLPGVQEIRERFNARRDRRGGAIEGALKRLLGFDAKVRQYRDGAAFVRQVREEAGDGTFMRVWERPENLPSSQEIASPRLWIERVG